MPALGGEPWRGMAQVKIADTAAPTQFKSITVSVSDVDPLINGSSQAIWDNDANNNTAWQLRVELGTSTVPPVNVDSPTEFRVRVYEMTGGGSGLQIGSEWIVSGLDPAALSFVHTRDNFCFDLDPLDGVFNDTSTDRKFGMLAVELQVIRTGGVPASRDYDVSSRGTGTQTPPSGATHSWGRGYFRQRMQLIVTTRFSNVSFGGAIPSTWTYPDSIFSRVVVNRTRYAGSTASSFANRLRAAPLGGLGAILRTQNMSFSETLTNLDHEFAAPSGINEDFPTGLASTVGEQELDISPNTFGTDNIHSWRSTSVPSGWTFVSERLMRKQGFGGTNMTPGITPDTATRTTPNDKVNFGLHTVGATVKLKNARNEFITSAHSAAVRQFNFKSYDISAAAEQSTLVSLLDPDASGVYTIPAIAYSGPITTTSRGTGPNGDTADHSLTGRDKGVRAVHPTVNQKSSASARLWALSDLLRLDVHPQKNSSTLVKDIDPFALPGDAEDAEFVLGDTMYLFAFVGDVNGTGLSGNQVKIAAFKPSGAVFGSEVDRITAIAPDLGWVTTNLTVVDLRPMGEARVRARVDVNYTGASGNYGALAAEGDAVELIGSLIQPVTIVPAYVFDAVAFATGGGIVSFK